MAARFNVLKTCMKFHLFLQHIDLKAVSCPNGKIYAALSKLTDTETENPK